MKIVIAGSRREFEQYVREQGLSLHEAMYADENHRRLQGLEIKADDVVRIGSWFKREDIDRLELMLRTRIR